MFCAASSLNNAKISTVPANADMKSRMRFGKSFNTCPKQNISIASTNAFARQITNPTTSTNKDSVSKVFSRRTSRLSCIYVYAKLILHYIL